MWVTDNTTLHNHSLTVVKYEIDGDDCHDPNQPFTTNCPSLPGQCVNVLEVPVQGQSLSDLKTSNANTSLESVVFTLNPEAKYAPLKRSATTSAVLSPKSRMGKETSDLASGLGRPGSDPNSRPGTAHSAYGGPALCRQPGQEPGQEPVFQRFKRSLISGMGDKEDSSPRLNSSWSRRLFSRSSRSRKGKPDSDVDVPAVPMIPDGFRGEISQKASSSSASFGTQLDSERNGPRHHVPDATPVLGQADSSDTSMSLDQLRVALPEVVETHKALDEQRISTWRSDEARCSADAPSMNRTSSTGLDEGVATLSHQCDEPQSHHEPGEQYNDVPKGPWDIVQIPRTESSIEKGATKDNATDSMVFSNASSEYLSPCLTSNTTNSQRMSSLMLSMPDTPQMAEFTDGALIWRESKSDMDRNAPIDTLDISAQDKFPTYYGGEAHNKLGRFQGYSLPIHDHASSATITKPASHEHERPELRRQASAQLVQSWDDGAQHRIGALSTLVEDMGYLGTLIN